MAETIRTKQSHSAQKKLAGTIFPLLRKSSKLSSLEQGDRSILHERVSLMPPIQEKLNQARLSELTFKHIFRICFSIFSATLLLWQNYSVFSIIDRAFSTHQLKDLQLIFAALIGATLTETYFILRIIVNFVFSLSDYQYEGKPKPQMG